MGYPSWGVRLPCDTPPVGLVHALTALVYRGNHTDAILNVRCIGRQRHAACASPRRGALVITTIGGPPPSAARRRGPPAGAPGVPPGRVMRRHGRAAWRRSWRGQYLLRRSQRHLDQVVGEGRSTTKVSILTRIDSLHRGLSPTESAPVTQRSNYYAGHNVIGDHRHGFKGTPVVEHPHHPSLA